MVIRYSISDQNAQLIHFTTVLPLVNECAMPIPFIPEVGIQFFFRPFAQYAGSFTIMSVQAVSLDGDEIYSGIIGLVNTTTPLLGDRTSHITIAPLQTSPALNIGCFRIKITVRQTLGIGEPQIIEYYSNSLKLIYNADSEYYSTLEYWCNEREFDMPFSNTQKCLVTVPVHIIEPQFKTKDEVYQKLNGENVVLYSTITREYEFETEYIPFEWHDALIVALSCDHLRINGLPVYKSADYSIDWDNKTWMDCGKEIMRATCKVIEDFNRRNSNGISVQQVLN